MIDWWVGIRGWSDSFCLWKTDAQTSTSVRGQSDEAFSLHFWGVGRSSPASDPRPMEWKGTLSHTCPMLPGQPHAPCLPYASMPALHLHTTTPRPSIPLTRHSLYELLDILGDNSNTIRFGSYNHISIICVLNPVLLWPYHKYILPWPMYQHCSTTAPTELARTVRSFRVQLTEPGLKMENMSVNCQFDISLNILKGKAVFLLDRITLWKKIILYSSFHSSVHRWSLPLW